MSGGRWVGRLASAGWGRALVGGGRPRGCGGWVDERMVTTTSCRQLVQQSLADDRHRRRGPPAAHDGATRGAADKLEK